MSNKQKYYAVVKGREPGIYTTWDACQKQINGYANAVYKSFLTIEEAEKYIDSQKTGSKYDVYSEFDKEDMIDLSTTIEDVLFAFVDGSFLKDVGYSSGAAIFINGEYTGWCKSGTDPDYMAIRNVVGEIEAAKYVTDLAIQKKAKEVVIFYDYAGIEAWATGAWSAKNECTHEYARYMERKRQEIEISFVKIAGHTGVPMNELADELAKRAIGL